MYRATRDTTGMDFDSLMDAVEHASSGERGRVAMTDGVFSHAEWIFADGELVTARTWARNGGYFELNKESV